MTTGNGGLVPVRIRDCQCPDKPHAEEGDIVYLLPHISTQAGMECHRVNAWAMEQAVREVLGKPRADEEELTAHQDAIGTAAIELLTLKWTPIYIRQCTAGWNVVDAEGEPVPYDFQVILDDFALGSPVAEAANDLYFEAVFRPLADRLRKLSVNGRTKGFPKATSRTRTSTQKRRARSSPATTADTTP